MSDPDSAATVDLLTDGDLTVEGRVVAASNLTLYARVDGVDASTSPCVYKPVSGERPLWDFPDGTLAARERAAYLVSEAGGWHLVPPTVLRDGPLGPGMCQQWVRTDDSRRWVDVRAADADPGSGWRVVLQGTDETGRAVLLVHRDDPAVRSVAVLDAVLNNADRKGGHLLADMSGRLWAIDHGVCMNADPKLRTVLWGWHGQPLTDDDQQRLTRLADWLATHPAELASLITESEVQALTQRVADLRALARMPSPSPDWPAIPWPAF